MALARARPDGHPMGMSNTQPLVAPRGDLSNKQSSDSDTRDRLRLTRSRAPSEHIDGAWWPASRRLAAELPGLLAAVHDRLGQVALVGYRRDDWTATPSLVDIGGERSVELLGLVSDGPPSVILIGQDGHHLTLRVIDPETNEELAGQALAEIPRRAAVAARPGASQTARSVVDVARKLALHIASATPVLLRRRVIRFSLSRTDQRPAYVRTGIRSSRARLPQKLRWRRHRPQCRGFRRRPRRRAPADVARPLRADSARGFSISRTSR